jgi:hypothetical protein
MKRPNMLANAENEIKMAWQAYKKVEKHGLTFWRDCLQVAGAMQTNEDRTSKQRHRFHATLHEIRSKG